MRAEEVERALRRIGLVFILGLVLQPRISGRPLLLPLFALAMVWALARLRPVVVSSSARRRLLVTMAVSAVVALLGVLGWSPGVEAGGLSVLVLVVFVGGVLAYIAFLRGWCTTAGWAEADDHYRRAAGNLIGVVVVTVIGMVLVVAVADPPPTGAATEWWNVIAGRQVGTWWLVGFSLLILITWVGACIELERGSKTLRAALLERPSDPAPGA